MSHLTETEIMALRELAGQIDILRHQFDEVKTERKKRLVEIHTRQYGVKVGSEVLARGKQYCVTEIIEEEWRAMQGIKPQIYGRLRKKNGTLGIQIHHILLGWELVKEPD